MLNKRDKGINHIIRHFYSSKMTHKRFNNPCKYDIHHFPMLKRFFVLKQTLDKTNKGRCILDYNYNNLLMLDNFRHMQARTTVNGSLK